MERLKELRDALALYHPCACGIHICGDRDGAAATFGNVSARDEAEARAIFAAARAETEAGPDEPTEFVVDLNLRWDNQHVEDFSITRQMLNRCLESARAAITTSQRAEK